MSVNRRISRTTITVLYLAFIALLALLVLQLETNAWRQPITPTPAASTKFVLEIPQKAMFKNYVFVSAEAVPGTPCELTYIPPSGAGQLMETTANQEGLCKWRWKIEEAGGKGAGRLIFTIDGKSETHFFEILSSF